MWYWNQTQASSMQCLHSGLLGCLSSSLSSIFVWFLFVFLHFLHYFIVALKNKQLLIGKVTEFIRSGYKHALMGENRTAELKSITHHFSSGLWNYLNDNLPINMEALKNFNASINSLVLIISEFTLDLRAGRRWLGRFSSQLSFKSTTRDKDSGPSCNVMVHKRQTIVNWLQSLSSCWRRKGTSGVTQGRKKPVYE